MKKDASLASLGLVFFLLNFIVHQFNGFQHYCRIIDDARPNILLFNACFFNDLKNEVVLPQPRDAIKFHKHRLIFNGLGKFLLFRCDFCHNHITNGEPTQGDIKLFRCVRISIRGLVRWLVGWLVRWSVGNAFVKIDK